MIVQWVGELPSWINAWKANTDRVTESGYGWHFLLDNDFASICRRITDLGVECPPLAGRKLCDYRPALGEMYAEEVAGFHFWGHTDLDCVYGNLWEYVTDSLLAGCDVFSNDPYPNVCGPFSLWRNTESVNALFRQAPNWRDIFEDPELHAFDETGIAPTLAKSNLRVRHEHFEGATSMYVHFHSSPKEYPVTA